MLGLRPDECREAARFLPPQRERGRERRLTDGPMASVDELTKLFHAVAERDWAAARVEGMRIATAEEEKGHHTAAQVLKGALLTNGNGASNPQHGEWLGDVGLLEAALTRLTGGARLSGVALRREHRTELASVVKEWRHRQNLEARGIPLRRKLLLHGPPGCGKSLTAQALATELGLPAYVIRIDGVVGAYLGQTALRIRQLFKFAESVACVLLLDEIDALGTRRGSQRDVGEIDRVVISLMQELEHAAPRGLVVATSNVPQQLDAALFRRFDLVLEFPKPTRRELIAFARTQAQARKLRATGGLERLLAGAGSYAEAERRIIGHERTTILKSIEE